MISNVISKRPNTAKIILALAAALCASASAEQVTFTLDPEQSTLLATGMLSGNIPSPQTFGGNLTSFSGTILADRTAGGIQFLDGSFIDAAPQSQRQEPDTDGLPGSATADYGWVADNIFGETVAAFRDISLGLLSDMLPMTGGGFERADVEILVAGGGVAWNSGFSWDTDDFSGTLRANSASNAATLVEADGVETLTLPIRFDVSFSTLNSGDSRFRLSGNLVATRETIAAPQWITDGGGSWGNGANWSTGAPAAGSASFLGALTAPNSPAVITLDGNRAVARLTFNNENTYDIVAGSGGILTVGGATTGSVNVLAGQHRITAPTQITGSVDVNVGDSATLSMTALLPISAGRMLNKLGGGHLNLSRVTNSGEVGFFGGSTDVGGVVNNNSGGIITVSEATVIFHFGFNNDAGAETIIDGVATFAGNVSNAGLFSGAGVKNFEGPVNNLGALDANGTTNIAAGASATADFIREGQLNVHGNLKINPDGTPAGTSLIFGLFIDSTGVFDLTDNHLIIDAGDLNQVADYIRMEQLTSSSASSLTTLGVMLNDRGGGTPIHDTWGGESVLPTDVLVRFTWKGDANLDGRVAIGDYLAIDRGFARELTGWQDGDFNGDGTINALDFFDIDQPFVGQGEPLSAGASPALPVPEPTAALLLPPLALLLRRRRA